MSSPRSAPLTKTEILETALEIIDTQGTDALSMRKLADRLGIKAMSLYHHFPNKEALLDGVVELSLAAQAPATPPGPDWHETVVAAVCGFRRALVAHPNVLPLMIAHPPTSPEASATYIEMPLRFLAMQDFSHRDAGQLFEALFAMAFGHALLTSNYPAIEIPDAPSLTFSEESFERSVRVLMSGYEPQAGDCPE